MLLVLCGFEAFSCELGFCRSHPYPDSLSFLRLFSEFNLVPYYNTASGLCKLRFPLAETSRYVTDQKVFNYGNDCRIRDCLLLILF